MSTDTAYDRVVDAIGALGLTIRKNGRGVIVQCPHHEDRAPSLGVLPLPGSVSLTCFAGCDNADVVADLGLRMSDLFDNQRDTVYRYPDGRKVTRSWNEKKRKKDFFQSDNDGKSSLFRVAEVKAAVAAGQPVYLVEGEKDTLAVEAAGGVATCWAGGVAGWAHCDPSPLFGGHVGIIVDNDEPGRKLAIRQTKTLDGKVKSLRFFQAKEGKDATDHLAAGYTLAELIPIDLGGDQQQEPTERAKPVRLDVFLATPDPVIVYLIEDVLPAGSNVLLTAQFKAGKSTLAANLARDLADKTAFLGSFDIVSDITGPIHIVDDELSEAQLRRELRAQGVVNQTQIQITSLRGRIEQFNILTADGVTFWAEQFKGAAVLIIDCLSPIMAEFGLSEDKDMSVVTTALNKLQRQAGVGLVILIHHMGHNGERPRGGSALRGWCDVEWKLIRPVEKGEDGHDLDDPRGPRYFSGYGRGVDVPEGRVNFDPETHHLAYVQGDRRSSRITGLIDLVRDVIVAEGGPCSKNKIEKGIRAHAPDVRAAIEQGERRGIFVVEVVGRTHFVSLVSDHSTVFDQP